MSTALSAPQSLPIPSDTDQSADWKQQLAERLDAYRAKHGESAPVIRVASSTSSNTRVSSIARAVASRYAAAPSYQELLLAAAQAEREAQAALERSQALQAALEEERRAENALASAHAAASDAAEERTSAAVIGEGLPLFSSQDPNAGATQAGAIPTQPGKAMMPTLPQRSQEMRLHQTVQEPEPTLEELLASSVVEPRAFLPSKLIEFPRELVSQRRMRPRLAENLSRETEMPAEPEPSQLRIFEVQAVVEPPAALSHAAHAPVEEIEANTADSGDVVPATEISVAQAASTAAAAMPQERSPIAHRSTATPESQPARVPTPPTVRAFQGLEWAAISLDKESAPASRKTETHVSDYVPFLVEPASIDRRLMAFAVDFAAVTAGFMGFLVVFVASTPHLPTGLSAIALSTAVYAALWVLYQMLFFSLSGATAGMMYARIALCTFDDQNPSRTALRRRLGAWWLSCLPLGMGFLWSFVDEDNLCWHDRMTRMYQRSY